MEYASWTSKKQIKNILTPVNFKIGVKKGGVPLMFEEEYIYLDDRLNHTLVIGSTGSGKTQTTILPTLRYGMMAKESIVVNDPRGEIYESMGTQFEKNGYEIVILNFDKPNYGNYWNPFVLPYKLYKDGNKDKALELIENIGYYLFSDSACVKQLIDPFWINSTIDYFTGITLYLFEKANIEEINLNSIFNLANHLKDNSKDFIKQLDKNSSIYFYVSGTLNSPIDTKGSILSVFNQKLKKYICRENLSNMMSISDFDIINISNKKTVIFIISGNSEHCSNLIPLFIDQTFNSIDLYGNKEKAFNILLDEFDLMLPIKGFAKIINYSRSINIRFVVVIKSYTDLLNLYGKENIEILKMCFTNVIYLLSNDINTLEEISNMCGKTKEKSDIVPLITVEELKILKKFEAIVIMQRMNPFRTNLIPDYKIYDNNREEKAVMKLRKNIEIKIFDINK